MNPKSVNDLDPKLKEAYERIMGTAVNPTGQNPLGSTSTTEKPAEQPVNEPQTPNIPLMQTQPVVNQNTRPLPTQNTQIETQSQHQTHNPFMQTPEPPVSALTQNGTLQATPQKKKINLLPIFLIIGGLIFFVVYIFVWARVFGLF